MPLPSSDKVFRWEYTLLDDDIFDDGREPSPITLATHRSPYPRVVLEADPPAPTAFGSGPWWLPQDLAFGGDPIDTVLRSARTFGMLPVIEADHLAAEAGTTIELIESHELRIPVYTHEKAASSAAVRETRRAIAALTSNAASGVSLAEVAASVNELATSLPGAYVARARLVSLRCQRRDAVADTTATTITVPALVVDRKSFAALHASQRQPTPRHSDLTVSFETELSQRLGVGPLTVDADFARNRGLASARRADLDSDDGAIVWLKRAAEVGDVESAFYLGLIRKNQGDDEGPDGSIAWFRRAAEDGHAESACAVGFYQMSRNEADGDDGGVAWFRRAADLGNSDAMYNLGVYYHTQGDEALAETACRNAAANGHAEAMSLLGRLLSDRIGTGGSPAWYDLDGEDSPEEWWQKAAERGSADAMLSLGVRRTLLGQFSGDDSALTWLIKAWDAGNEHAALMIGVHRRQEGVIDGPDGALEWLGRVADQGNPLGMLHIGELLHSRGDVAVAESWYKQAATLGEAKAMLWLGSISAQRAIDEGLWPSSLDQLPDENSPEHWWRQSAEAGIADAMYNLGTLRFQQRELAGDDGAVAWWLRAADAGHQGAIDQLMKLKQTIDEANGTAT